jgi:hypothetical protein
MPDDVTIAIAIRTWFSLTSSGGRGWMFSRKSVDNVGVFSCPATLEIVPVLVSRTIRSYLCIPDEAAGMLVMLPPA